MLVSLIHALLLFTHRSFSFMFSRCLLSTTHPFTSVVNHAFTHVSSCSAVSCASGPPVIKKVLKVPRSNLFKNLIKSMGRQAALAFLLLFSFAECLCGAVHTRTCR